MTDKKNIGIVGGTGREGKGLAYRWLKNGHKVYIGSRNPEKALEAVNELKAMLSSEVLLYGGTNEEIVEKAEVVVLCIPYAAHKDTLVLLKDKLKGKILIDVTVPLVPPKVTRVQMPADGSAAQEAKGILGEEVLVVSAFQNISYENLMNDGYSECDVLVTGDKAGREVVLDLVSDVGLTGWDAGPIENSVVAEGLTSILIGINKLYGAQSSGIKITGVKR